MKKDSKQRLFEVMSRLDKTFKPKLNENVESSYESVELKGHYLDEDAMDYFADLIFKDIDTDLIVSSRDGDLQEFNINNTINDIHVTPVGRINIDRIVGSMWVGYEAEPSQKGGLETEPIQGYWGGFARLEELSLVDDKNRIIYNIPKDGYIFNAIAQPLLSAAKKEYNEDWLKDQYNPY